jgi:hypothetical protein
MSDSKKANDLLLKTLIIIETCKLHETSESWRKARKIIKKILSEKPGDMTRAYEKMPVQINLNDPSLPVTKNQ